MNLNEIRADEELVKWWAQVCKTDNFYKINKMMQDTHPLRFVETTPVTTSTAEKRLGMIEGYELAMEKLRLCSEFLSIPTHIIPSFEPPEVEVEFLEPINKTKT